MTQTQEPMDCSDAAKMIIARMQTNPEDFAYGGKLYRVGETSALSARDRVVVNAAHDEYIKEPNLMAEVLKALLVQPEKEETGTVQYRPAMTFDSSGNLGITGTTANNMWFDEVTQTVQTNIGQVTREMYEAITNTNTVRQPGKSVLSQIYNRTAGRQRIERDN